MKTMGTLRRRASIAALAIALFLLLPYAAFAHAVLVRSTPASNATVKPGDVHIQLTYNSRIDATRSSVSLLAPDGKQQTLTLGHSSLPNVLTTTAPGLAAGGYQLQWQVLASDGHITRGIVAFHVS